MTAAIPYAVGVPLDWKSGALAEGIRRYRNLEFFDAHEHWESVWLTLQEPQKTFLQALIQITAAFHHLQAGNPRGATSLLRRALRRLEVYPASFEGIDLAQLRREAGAWLQALESGADAKPVAYPRIRPDVAGSL
ncbi:conserved hypothetical protein [Candidatus Sulfotelmatomonas gaucii]|uniref:DUF309 domain-containing protein n=1 Tax=Candidatus Sulfuritelmatomonas gaucii TaxID=2043161 RepID=A0A2N9LA08_9BACT|nr:conserved hypothetical protein [Candidatus Sulfotelmatomonas gaucii]